MDRLQKKKSKSKKTSEAKIRDLTPQERAKEKRLEDAVFGGNLNLNVLGAESKPTDSDEEEEQVDENQLFVVDTKRRKVQVEAEDSDDEDSGSQSKKKADNSAWVDEDDEEVSVNIAAVDKLRKLRKAPEEKVVTGSEYSKRMREHFTKVLPTSSWVEAHQEKKRKKRETEKSEYEDEEAEVSGGEDKEEGGESGIEAILRRSAKLLNKSSGRLQSNTLSVTRAKDANRQEPSKAVIQSVNFHPNGQILLTAGFDKTIRLFQIDGSRNPKIQSVFIPDMPIHQAFFTPSGSEILASGRRKGFYVYDVEGGRVNKIQGLAGREEKSLESMFVSPDGNYISFLGNDGYVLLASGRTKQLVGQVKMNGTSRAVAFSPDSTYMYTSGGDGEIYHWDLRTRSCVHRHFDDGILHCTSLAASKCGQFLASGSDTGVVNVYSTAQSGAALSDKPIKTVMSLTTSVQNLGFNSDSQILAISSKWKRDAMRLIHMPSLSVFSNWPTANTPLHFVTSFDFSPSSGYMAIGNDRGKVLLYRLNHYSTA